MEGKEGRFLDAKSFRRRRGMKGMGAFRIPNPFDDVHLAIMPPRPVTRALYLCVGIEVTLEVTLRAKHIV